MKQIAIGVLAHVDSGKTTLSEALLYCAGAISKLGRVDHRDSFLDTNSIERSRGITVFSKQAVFQYGDTGFTLLDTPGHADFSAETERTLQVLDYAILVISGTDGVQSHTVTLWKLLQKYGVPVFLFVNKMDLDGAQESVILHNLRQRLSENCVDFTQRAGDSFFESCALCDETLLAAYDERDDLSREELIDAIRRRTLYPVMFGSALRTDGVDAFLQTLCDYTAMPAYPDAFGAKVFKIAQDAQKNRLTFLKITGGSLKVKDTVRTAKTPDGEKVNQIRIYSGEKFQAVDEAPAGTVCAVTGLSAAQSGEGLGCETDSAMPVLEPVLTYRLDLQDGTDIHTALQYMRQLESEDPQLRVAYQEQLGEIQVQLMGEIQLEILRSVIAERFGMQVGFDRGNIIYKETIAAPVEGVGHFEPLRHYAEVHLILRPAARDSGLRFVSECKEDVLDKNWQRLILTHLYEKTHRGVLTGSPITDMTIVLASGKAHLKHTEGGDFRQATYRAVRMGLRSAESVLLEPIYDYVLEVPQECVGRAIADVQRMSGSFDPPETAGDFAVLKGKCPVSEMCDYHRELVQYTRGTGKLSCTFSGYEVCHNADEVIAAIGYDCDADVQNTADSVFCAHGAGYTVKWNEVRSHMHLPSALSTKTQSTTASPRKKLADYRNQKDIFAADKELMQIFEQTYGPVKKHTFEERPAFSAEQKPQKEPKPAPPRYEGEEYLLVDGYNVIFAWDDLRALSESSIDAARNTLINILCNYQGWRKCEVILVFDAYKVKGNTREVEHIQNISVVYTKEAETADMYIEKVTHKLAKKHKVQVVTSDALEQLIILGNGALRISSRAFYDEVQRAQEEIRALLEEGV